jgi:uncharacterized protein YndB with AHSA1/START domain
MQPAALTISRVIRAPRAKVFAAWTEPDLLTQWWGPGPTTCPEAHVDLREGGSYRLANRDQDGSIVWISGTFERVRAPDELVYTWTIGDGGAPSLVTVEFRPHTDGTEIVLTHERIASEPVREMHLMGWNGCLDKLEAMFAN